MIYNMPRKHIVESLITSQEKVREKFDTFREAKRFKDTFKGDCKIITIFEAETTEKKL